MQQMFKDMTISKEYIAQFREQKGSAEISGVEFNVEVLTNGHWPNEGEPTCSIPPEMTKCRADFEQFYKHKRQAQERGGGRRRGNTKETHRDRQKIERGECEREAGATRNRAREMEKR